MICVDSSVAVKWVFREEYSKQSLAIVRASARSGERIAGPALLPIEVTNAIRRRMLSEGLSLGEGRRLLGQFFSVPIILAAPEVFSERALAVADTYGLPAVYDAYYVALAQLLECDLWTNDQRLLRALGGGLPFVKWIGDYPLA